MKYIQRLAIAVLFSLVCEVCWSQQDVHYQMNYFDTKLSEEIQTICSLSWLRELMVNDDVIIYASNQMKDLGNEFCVMYLCDNQYLLIGISKENNHDYRIANISTIALSVGNKIFQDVTNKGESFFCGTQYSKYGYSSYLYISYCSKGNVLYSFGLPILSWGTKTKIQYPVSGDTILYLWDCKYKLFK